MSRTLFGLVPILIILAIIMVELATDLYAPVMPSMMLYFGVEEYRIQLTVMADLLGIALSGVLLGPLSDSYGRRKILLIGMSIFLLASIAAMLAPWLSFLLTARFLQGFGGGVAIVVGIAVIKDLYNEKDMARIISFIAMVIAVSPGVAPILGGYIGAYTSWRGIFAVLAVLGAIVLWTLYRKFPETLPAEERSSFNFIAMLKNYLMVVQNREYLLYTLLGSLAVSIWWLEIVNLPFLYISEWGILTQHYGFYFGTAIAFFVAGTIVNQFLIDRFSIDTLLLVGLSFKILSAMLMFLIAIVGIESAILLQMALFPGAFGLGIFFAHTFTKALSAIDDHIGAASAFITLAEMTIASIAMTIVGLAYNGTLMPLALAEVVWALLSLVIVFLLKK